MPARQAVISLPIEQVAQLERFEAVEHLSELFVIQADVLCAEAEADFLPHLGEAALITVSQEGESQRAFSGLIFEAEFMDEAEAGFRYRLTLRPWLYALTRNLDFVIFQNMSALQIIEKVFETRNCHDVDYSHLQNSYPPREYCVQYRESDFDFVSRLMEEEGIYYFFNHTEGRHVMVLCDDRASHEESVYESLPYLPYSQSTLADRVWRWTEHVSTGTEGKVTYRNFDFTRPTYQLQSTDNATPDEDGDGAMAETADMIGRLVGGEPAPTGDAAPAEKVEIYDFPADFLDDSRGADLTGVAMKAAQASNRSYNGEGDAVWLACGTLLTIKSHPIDRLNQSYLINGLYYRVENESFTSTTDVYGAVASSMSSSIGALMGASLGGGGGPGSGMGALMGAAIGAAGRGGASGSGAGPGGASGGAGGGGADDDDSAVISLVSTPADTPWRAPQRTPHPVARGPETAIVTGNSGDTIYTDKYGRVKVRFHWDRGPESPDPTCWIRVAWASADNGFGHVVLPRVGQEVVVDFVNGDPDQPLVVGTVYNGDKNPPYDLPGDKTRSVWRSHTIDGGADDFNEMSFEDKTGEEEIKIQAQKDRNTLVKNDDNETVQHNQTIIIKNDLSTTVQEGNETRQVSKGKRTTTIQADETLTVNQGNMQTTVSEGNKTIDVSQGDYSLKTDSGQITIEADKKITLKVGSSTVVIDQTSITLQTMNITTTAQTSSKTSAPEVTLSGSAMTTITGGVVKIN